MPSPLPVLPTTLVGSYPQPEWLVRRDVLMSHGPPRVRLDAVWRFAPPLRAEAQRDALLLAVDDMERAGIDVVSDGEMNRESYFNLFATGLDGVDLDRPGEAISRTGTKTWVPRVTGDIRWRASALADAARTLRAATKRPIKMTVPGPFTLAVLAQDERYRDPRALAFAYADAVNRELRELKAAGVDVVQIDEPYMQARPDEARDHAVAAIDRALDGIPGETAVHLCFGYAYVVKDKPAGYAFLGELDSCAATQISIEAAQPGLDPAILARLPRKKVMYGVLDLGTERVETPEEVAARLRAALRHAPPERLVPAPDCGMKYLPRAAAFGKLQAMCRGVAAVRREIGA